MRNSSKTMVLVLFSIVFIISCSSRTKLSISNLPDRFTDRETIANVFYMPDTHLVNTENSVMGWDRRITKRFGHAPGKNIVLHAEHSHYDEIGAVIDPDYSYQVNLEIPREFFEEGEKIPAAALEGYLVWGGFYSVYHRDFAPVALHRQFVPSEKGELHIKKIRRDNVMIANMNLYFNDAQTGEQVRVHGKVVAPMKTREAFLEEERRSNRSLYQRMDDMEKEAWSPRHFKSKHTH